ncbi:MAG: hypothetical protein ACIAQF_09055 [Phycisphaerales bacterium JB065]
MARLRTLVAFALSVALIPAGAALAQSPDGGRGGAGGGFSGGSGSGGTASLFSTETVIDIDFGGGTLPEYYEHIQQRTGVRNIILASEDLADVLMPEVKLSSVQYPDAVELPYFLTSFSDDRRFDISEVGSSKSIFVVSTRNTEDHKGGAHSEITFDFKGGSLSEFVRLVQDAAGQQQVLVRGDADNFMMPPLRLENVTLHGVLMALDGDTRQSSQGERSVISSGFREGVYVVEVISKQAISRSQAGPSALQTMSWSLAALRGQGRLSIEEVLAAIEAAVEVSGDAERTTVRFHDPTSLLIVSARADTIAAINDVIAQLQKSSDEAMREHARRQAKVEHIDDLRMRHTTLLANIRRMEDEMHEIKNRDSIPEVNAMQIYQRELIQAKNEVEQVLQELGRLESEMQRP